MRATPRRSALRWPSSPLFSTGSDATNRRPPSPGSRSVLCLRRRSPKSPAAITHLRGVLGEADLRIARPQGRDDDHRRHGDLRIRPNRPGPNRTRTPQLSCASRVSSARAPQHVLNRLQQSVRPRLGIRSHDLRRALWLSCSPVRHWHACAAPKRLLLVKRLGSSDGLPACPTRLPRRCPALTAQLQLQARPDSRAPRRPCGLSRWTYRCLRAASATRSRGRAVRESSS